MNFKNVLKLEGGRARGLSFSTETSQARPVPEPQARKRGEDQHEPVFLPAACGILDNIRSRRKTPTPTPLQFQDVLKINSNSFKSIKFIETDLNSFKLI